MRRAVLFFYSFILLFFLGCKEVSREQAAAEAALSYYERILEGYPDGLVAAKVDVDSLPDERRQQLVKAYHQYVADMKHQHGGLQAVSISSNVGRSDTLSTKSGGEPVTYAFLLLTFADSTQEEICVPMVERDGDWFMR